MSNQSGEVEVALSQPKLPAIGDSRNLVSQPLSTTHEDLNNGINRERSFELMSKSSGELENEDVKLLFQLVSRRFVNALQENTKQSWLDLCHVLDVVKPYAHFLAGSPQIVHYVERAFQNAQDSQDDGESTILLKKLSAVFPAEFSLVQDGARPKHVNFPAGSSEESLFTPRGQHAPLSKRVQIPRGEPLFPGGTTYTFDKTDGDMMSYGPKPLCLEDLKRSLPSVVREIAFREATLRGSLGTTVLALDTDFPQTRVPIPPLTPRRSPSVPIIKTPISEAGCISQLSESKKPNLPKTGREVVECYVKGRFLGEVKFAFLNVAPSVRYDPYNLVVVPENKVKPEHYLISSHCVLHVNPFGPSESQSLAEWYREACLFKAISSIEFFKNYLITKMFRKWKGIKKLSHFLKVESAVERSLISNVPSFGSALLRISSLLQDLEKITFLPFQVNFSYSLEEFEDAVFRTCDKGYQYMEKFFNYCQMIVDKTQESCFEYLEYCEGQVKNHRHNYHESLAVGKRKRAIRQQNLKLARNEVRRLGTFVSLVDHIIVSNLLTLVQGNISRFVNETMPGPRPERDGLFSAEIVFGDDHKLMLSPPVKQYAHAVDFAVRSVVSASCNLSHAMELGQKAQAFQEKAGKNATEEGSSEDDDPKLNGSVAVESVYTKEKKIGGDIENLTYGMSKDSQTVLTGQQRVSYATTTIMTHFTEEPDTLHSDSSITRTDGEINEDLDGLNSDLLSARDMKEVSAQELCLHQEHSGGLLVEGQRFQDFAIDRSPLTKEKMMHIMYKNQQIKQGLMYQTHLLAEASQEVELFCDDHTWVAEIHEFVTSWGGGQVENWRGQLAIKIEQQLNQIKTWKEKVLSMTKSFCTENGIFFVDCHAVQQKLLPQLTSIFKQMVQMVALDVVRLSHEMVTDVDKLSQLLADPKTDIRGFADFMQKLSVVKEHIPSLKEKVEYIKNLYEVIRSCYRQLTPEEEVTEEKVWATWEGFLFSLQEASDFAEMHRSQVSEKLLETISALEQSAEGIGKAATSGQFLDPNENPKLIVQSIRELRDKFTDVCSKLSDLSKCQAVILGKEYNLKHVTDILEAIDKRKELWRYCDTSSHAIREWLQTVFKKMNVKKAMSKLTEWNNAGEKLKKHVPNNDEVLHSWLTQLEEFSQDLPLLLQLSSDALKSRHWRALFIGMGQDYDPTWDFTVADLLSFHLGRYKDLISAICSGAAAEYALELQLNQLARGWEEKDFKLAKHIPLVRPRMEGDQRKNAKGKRKTKQTGHGTEKKNVKVKPKTPASVPDVFILIGVGDLKCVIEDNMVTLHTMLASPHVVDLKPMVETWITNLQEIENIIDIWADSQKKWLYLSNVFAEPEIRKSLEESNQRFLEVDEKYREYVQVILKDPKVMSVLPLKKRGEKGWRELQGDVLRELLLELIRKEEELIRLVEKYIEKTRVEFPRLFFLSDNDLLGLLAWSRNPKGLLPFVRKCFPGIKNLQFTLPRDGNLNLASSLDTALNAHLLQVTALEGILEEVLPLISVIPASPRPQGWLATLEERMRNTLVKSLAECVQRRLRGKENPSDLLEMTTIQGPQGGYQDHILLKFPSQCVLTTEAIMWSKDMSEALQNGSLRGLSDLKKSLAGFMDDISGTIRKNMECNDINPINNRLGLLLAALAAMTIHQRDTVADFMKQGITDVNSFEWASQLQHQIEMKPVLSSSYQGDNNDSSCSSKTIPINHLYEVGRCSVRQLGTSFVYGYEYLGPTPRLVVTPLTQRCFLTLTMALRSHQCGVPVGPDGIGKTETIKDLSKAFARHLVMFNCSEQLTNSMLVRFLYGMIRSGSWVCFENVDCLGAGILSYLGQHLSTIRTSLKCLEKLVSTQYTTRGFHKQGTQEVDNVKRRSSVTTLHSLPNEPFMSGSRPDSLLGNHLAKGRRHHLVLEGGDLQEADYYSDATRFSSLEEQSKLQETFQDSVGIEHRKELTCKEFEMPLLGNIVFEGQLMPSSEMYGCFMTMSKSYSLTADLPENFRAQLRPMSMVFPDCRPVVEVWLVGCGFTEAKPLSLKMDTFFKLINQQVSCQPQYSFGLRSMRMVTLLAGKQLLRNLAKKRPNTMGSIREESSSDLDGDTAWERKTKSPFLETLERRQSEENAVVHSLFTYFGNKLLLEDKELFSRGVDEVFAHSVLMSVSTEGDPHLVEQVKEHLQANGLQVRQEVISKILQLYTSLQTSRSVILLGCPGSGKSTIYSTLVSALNTLIGKATQPVVKTRRQTVTERKMSSALKQAKAPVEEIKDVMWPRVDLSVVFPKSLTCEELFGRQLPDNNVWVDGVVSKWLRDSTLTRDTMAELLTSQFSDKQRIARMMGSLSHVKKWLVLDGPMDDTWLENMGTLLDSTRALNLPSGETISQPETVTLLFEVTELSHVSPALVTRCGLIHCPETTVGWKSIFRSWMKGAHAKWDITNRGLGIISCLMDHSVDSTLKFLSNNCQSVLIEGYGSVSKPSKTAAGIYEVQTLLRYLSAIFDRHILREDDDSTIHMMQRRRQSVSSTSSRQSSGIPASDTGKVTSSFAFAFVWAFGGHLHERYAPKFDEHARQLMSSGPYPVLVPPDGSVYDYCLDFSKGALVKWDERPGAQFKTLPSSYTVVSELDRYFYLMDLMVSSSQPVLLVGSTGSGKTSLMQNLIYPRHNFTRICLSPGLTSKLLQEAIEYKLQLIQRKEMSPMALQNSLAANAPTSKNLPGVKSRTQLLFLDDLNCADVDEFGIQPPLELLRQILSQGTLYDKQRHHSCRVQRLKVMAACVPPGAAASCGGVASYPVSHRLSRLMTVLSFFSLSSESLQSIYSAVFVAWLEEFPTYSLTHHEQLAKALSSATIKMYSVVQQELRPTPLYPHFLFTHHELSRVVQGMTSLYSKTRGRPRPRARRRTEGGGEVEQESKGAAIPAANSDQSFRNKDSGPQGGFVGKGRSWPSLTNGPRETALSASTPAVLSPMIRSLLRLWCHESTRTYGDRLLTEEQRHWFSSLLHKTVEEFFCRDNSEMNSEMFSVEQGEIQQEMAPGTNVPLPTTSCNQVNNAGQDDSDDSMALPDKEHRESGNESDEVLSQNEEEEEAGDSLTAEVAQDGVLSPEGQKQVIIQGDPTVFIVSEEQGLSREDTGVENNLFIHPTRVKVTFDDTSGASFDKSYSGPLISSEQLAFSGEDLTDIMFCKHYNASVTGRESSASEVASKNYLECAESILEQGIKRWLSSYNEQVAHSSSAKIMNLVTFREALQHAARLSRALAMPGGHALLLSSLGYGRRTLTRVTAHAARYKLIEVQRSQFQSQEDLRQQIKMASFIAGLQGKQVVLFVPEGVNDESMQDICSLMAEGTCPGLYTSNELFMISNQLLPGVTRGARRVENQDIAQERYFRRIKSNLHVVVCLKYTPLSLSTAPEENQLYRFPVLVTRSCCVDIYRAWPHKALVSVAEKLLEEGENVLSLVPLKRRERHSQSAAVCSIMAHVHLSSRSMVEKIYGVRALKFYSPDTYLDFVYLFRNICKRLCVKEKEEVTHLEKAIKRIDEATKSLNKMQRELDQLVPVFEASTTDVQLRQEAVEACQKEYAAAKETCKKQEQDIEFMQGPIETLKREAQAEFEKVNPLFDAAWRAIDSLNIYDVEEIRSYRAPPELVILVVDAICLLFKKEKTWEEGKLLLNRSNFFKDLEFYDMKSMSDSTFRGLKVFYDNPKFRPEIVQEGSVAARSLCLWVRAVYEFCLVYRALEPKRQQLARAEEELEKAKSILGEMRVKCNAVKQELESNIQLYKDSVKHSRTVEKQIQSIEAVKSKGAALVDSLFTYSDLWHSRRSSAQQRLLTAPGDALVTAAAVCYLGPLAPAAREHLFSDWLQVCDGTSRDNKERLLSLSSMVLDDARNKASVDDNCKGEESRPTTQSTLTSTLVTGNLPLREDVSLQTILSSPNEVDEWRRNDLPTDEHALQNVLILRSCGDDRSRAWPLLIDPHNQAELWIRALHEDDALGNQSRPGTRLSDRSSTRQSRRSSIESESAALDYTHLEQSGADEYEADAQFSDNEVDQFLQSLKEPGDQDPIFQESETAVTSRTERTAGSGLTMTSERMLKDKLAEAMGIQMESSPQPVPSGPTPVLNLSGGDILIVPADDPELIEKLRAAVKRGLVTLVTHVERRRWSKSLELLLMRQTFTNTGGILQVIIGKTAVDYNPSFRLYLSSSQPLFMTGEGLYPLPFSKVCTISMAVSREGICNMLLADTLRLERPEFEGQLRSVERDVGLHKQQIFHAEEFILERVLNLGGPLLKDSAMLESVMQSKEDISLAEEGCHEAEKMKQELLAKQDDFLPVAQHGALLFVVLSELHKLHPYYRYPLESFLKLFHVTIAERNRGKKSSGSPGARAAELITALSRKAFDRTSWSLFQSDNHLFPFLLAVEKMMNKGIVTREEWQIFTRMSIEAQVDSSVSNIDSSAADTDQYGYDNVQKPPWVSDQAWDCIDKLEVLPVFSGLKQSLAKHSEQWREYFNLPPVLLGITPGDYAHLTFFQKALLWKTVQPDQLFHVCQDIVLYQMGATMTQSVGYNLQLVYPVTSRSRPVLFLLPSQRILSQGESNVFKGTLSSLDEFVDDDERRRVRSGSRTSSKAEKQMFKQAPVSARRRNPVTDVTNVARSHNKIESLIKVTFGEADDMDRPLAAVTQGMKTGCWVILENCHLAARWTEEFLHQLETIVNVPEIIAENETEKQFMGSTSEEKSEMTTKVETMLVHRDFRLWLTTRPDVGLPLPAVVIQSGIKLACEAQENLRDSVRTNCQVALGSMNKCIPIWGPAAENSVFKSELDPYAIFKLAYLHVSLLQRRKYGEGAFSCPYQWLQADLLAGIQALRHTSRACNSSLSLAAVEVMLGHVTYGGHVTNGLDLNAVKSIARWDPTVQSRLGHTKDVQEYKYLDNYIDSLPDTISCQELGLTEASSSTYQRKLSSAVVDCLSRCTGLQAPLLSMDNEVKLIAKKTVNQISTIMDSVKSHDLAHEAPTSVTSFIQRELAFFKTLLEEAMQSLELLIKACCGLIAFTPGLFKLALSLGHRRTPLKWLNKPGTDVSLAAWMVNISKQVKTLSEYLLSSPVHPSSFCLGAFAHPQAFLACVLMDHARSAMKSVYALEFSIELLHPDTLPTSPPSRGVYLSKLKLNGASWDTVRNCISELLASNGSCDLPIIWLKPLEVIRSRAPSAKMERQGNDIPVFDCPLLTGQDWGTDFSTLVTSLPLPSVVPGESLKQRRVSIVSML